MTSLLYQLLSPQHFLRFHFSFLKREAHSKLHTAAVLEGSGGKCLLRTAAKSCQEGSESGRQHRGIQDGEQNDPISVKYNPGESAVQ